MHSIRTLALVATAAGALALSTLSPLNAANFSSGRRYNEVRQKSAHNSYTRQEALLDQLVYHRLRSIELDIHIGKSGWSPVATNWYVYHADVVAAGTTCHRLSDCLQELRAFHDAVPNHEVVTVWVDLKDDWQPGTSHGPTDLDARILQHLPASAIWKPSDAKAACPGASTLQQAVTAPCSWPGLSSLEGKFIFALTGAGPTEPKMAQYTGGGLDAFNHLAFIAPSISSWPSIYTNNGAVFLNLNVGDRAVAQNVNVAGLVSRVWGIGNASEFNSARSYSAHHLASDYVNFHQDPWTITHNSHGWPFQCFTPCDPALVETHRVLGVQVNSEDIWGGGDHFRYLAEYTTIDGNWWTTSVSTPNSHVEEWGKGCLMARAGTSGGSPNFAVCRPADEHKLRIQWRTSQGGSTNSYEVNIAPADTIDQESLTHIALYVYSGSRCAAGYGSQNGQTWTGIGAVCFNTPLYYQGVASSSHGNASIKFLYTNLAKNSTPYGLFSFPYWLSIGTVRSATAFDGVFP